MKKQIVFALLLLISLIAADQSFASPPAAPAGFPGVCKTIPNPNDADLWLFYHSAIAFTPRKVWGIAVGGTSVAVQIQKCTSAGASCAGIHDALTVDTDAAETTTFTDTSIAAGAVLKLDIGTVTGTVSQVMVCLE